MSKVSFRVDYETEMLSIEVDGRCVFGGNFWDFNRPKDIMQLVQTLGHEVVVVEEDWYADYDNLKEEGE